MKNSVRVVSGQYEVVMLWMSDAPWLPNNKQNAEAGLQSLTLSLPECLMEFCKVTLTFESVDEILSCDHLNESSLPVLTHGVICFSKFPKMKFGYLVKISF